MNGAAGFEGIRAADSSFLIGCLGLGKDVIDENRVVGRQWLGWFLDWARLHRSLLGTQNVLSCMIQVSLDGRFAERRTLANGL